MPTVEVSIRVTAPPEAIGAVLLDADRAPEWTAGLERLELVEGEAGVAGCVGHAHYRQGGRSYVLVDVLEQATPDRHYVSRITGGGITARVETTLEPVGDEATRMTLRWDGRGTTFITRLILPFMRRSVARRALADLEKLRSLAEDAPA